jgi:hypothetical protein
LPYAEIRVWHHFSEPTDFYHVLFDRQGSSLYPSHGYRIAQRIKERSQGVLDFKEGTLYPALHKLENEGLVESYDGIEKGRPRR